LLTEANARVVAISTSRGALFNPKGLDVEWLRKLAAEVGSQVVEFYPDAERIGRAELLELPVDLLCPCARHNSVHVANADRVKARIISAGANNPVTPEAERMLFKRGVLCLPDFVTNSGGVLGGTMEFASVDRLEIAEFIERHIGERIAWILSESDRQGVLPRDIAVPLSLSRFNRVRQHAGHKTLRNRFFQAGLELYRSGWIPGRLVASLSLPYFKRSLG
jgi:glutamate dehydrogenase (NAD(P)+)